MKLGTEDKNKVWVLAALGAVAVYFLYTNVLNDPNAPPAKPSAVVRESAADSAAAPLPASLPTSQPAATPPTAPRPLNSSRSRSDEFHPTLHSKRKEDQINPFDIDPTLRLDLLAKVQAVKLDGGQRNLFQFGQAAPVPVLAGAGPIVVPVRPKMDYPRPYQPPPPHTDPPPPPPPPITMKYYGLATKRIDGKKTAFFLDGEEILLATEGMTVKKRYKIVRINAETVVIEDTEVKREQTLRVSEDAGGAL